MSLRERTRSELGNIEPCLPSPLRLRLPGQAGCTKSSMTVLLLMDDLLYFVVILGPGGQEMDNADPPVRLGNSPAPFV